MTLTIRKPYDASVRVDAKLEGESLTKQSMAAECDINNIMRKYEKTGILNHARTVEGRYGDFMAAPELQEAMNQVRLAEEMFMTLPSAVRKRFDNDAAGFLEFAQNPENQEEIYSMGLAERPERPPEPPVPEGPPEGDPPAGTP